MAKTRMALELGMGTSLRKGDYTRAAVRAACPAQACTTPVVSTIYYPIGGSRFSPLSSCAWISKTPYCRTATLLRPSPVTT